MPSTKKTKKTREGLPLRPRVNCPHCWNVFRPGEILWVSTHPDLMDDPRLGADAHRRFLPTRFTLNGLAVDVKGVNCQQLACPKCHLIIPRALLEMPPLFISILGAPSSGKSYFLAAMTWQLRRTMARHFSIGFGDADPVVNEILNSYEETLFLSTAPQNLVRLAKTAVEGDWYNSVKFEERTVFYPKPFVFSMQPQDPKLDESQRKKLSRALCLYDNAGEHFMPGMRTAVSDLVTRHLALSQALLFLFDPTQHPGFRQDLKGRSRDPQFTGSAERGHRQDQVILEAAARIRAQTGLSQASKCTRPLIIVLTKYDAWAALAGGESLETRSVVRQTSEGVHLDVGRLKRLSDQILKMLLKRAPELITAIQSFADDVLYVPVSALGCSPIVDESTGGLLVRPAEINPQFAEVPLLYALHRATDGLIPAIESRATSRSATKTRKSKRRRSVAPQLPDQPTGVRRPEPPAQPTEPPAQPEPPVPEPSPEPATPQSQQEQPKPTEQPKSPADEGYLAEPADEGYLSEPDTEGYLAEPTDENTSAQASDQDHLKETGS